MIQILFMRLIRQTETRMKNKKNIIYIVLVILIASSVAYFYLTDLYKSVKEDLTKIYTVVDFPNALDTMNKDILEKTLEELNLQYTKIQEGDHIYVRWINIGILKKRLNDFKGTEEAWQDAISYDSEQSLAYGNLADLYLFNMKEYEKAEEYYLKVLSVRQDNHAYYVGLVSLYRYNMTEKANLIEGIMIRGAETNPSEAENYYMYLSNYFYYGPNNHGGDNKTKASYYAQKVLEINPELEDQLLGI